MPQIYTDVRQHEIWQVLSLHSRYHNQAAKDFEIVFRCVQQLLHQLNQPADTITEKEVKLFCKYARSIHVVRGSSIADEYDPKTPNAQNIGE
jgi:amyloid beta precursor protein binding protein 1